MKTLKIENILFILFIFITTSAFSQEDLSIKYIQRLPEIEYVQNSSNPAIEGWPAVGQQVTWRVKVKSWGTSTATVNYRWYVDDVEVGAGSKIIQGGSEVNIDYNYNWTFDRKVLKFVIDSENYFNEVEENNNEVSIFTDALSTGFYIEQGLYDYFHQHQNQLGVGSNSFEDWAHRQVEIWNDMLANSVTADTPNGVLDRIRLDKITVIPDGDLPLAGGSPSYPTNLPAIDKTIDLIWGFPTNHYLGLGTFSNKTDATLSNPFYFDRGLFHELGHARYLVDVYGFNIEYEGGEAIDIQENGVDINDAGLFPIPYRTDMPGLMNGGDYTQVDAYSTMALNLIAGHRAVCGNNNAPCNIGSTPDGFMQDLPAQNRVLITDENGLPVPGASIKIYQSEPGSNEWYGERFDNIPDLTFTSDAQGYINVGRNPFSDGNIVHTYGHSNATVIVRAEKGGDVGYTALHSWQFNMEYWRGNTALGTYQLAFDNIVANSCTSFTQFNVGTITSQSIALGWQQIGDFIQIYWRVAPDGPWQTAIANTNTYTITGLNPNTEYRITLKNLCTNTYTSPQNVTTLSDSNCQTPVVINAAGDEGLELMTLEINGQDVQEWVVTTDYQNYNFTYDGTVESLRVHLSNHDYVAGEIDYNLNVDYIVVNDNTIQTNAPATYGKGVKLTDIAGYCNQGTDFTKEKLFCIGFFEYSLISDDCDDEGTTYYFITNRATGDRFYPESHDHNAPLLKANTGRSDDWVQWEKIPTSNGYFYLKNKATGKYIRPKDGNDAVTVWQVPTNYTGSYTQWMEVPAGGDFYHLQNRETGKFFRPLNDTPDAPILQQPSTWTGHWTQWTIEPVNAPKLQTDNLTFNLYPNPTDSYIHIETQHIGENSTASIYDTSGKLVIHQAVIADTFGVPVKDLKAGIYIFRLDIGDGTYAAKYFVVK